MTKTSKKYKRSTAKLDHYRYAVQLRNVNYNISPFETLKTVGVLSGLGIGAYGLYRGYKAGKDAAKLLWDYTYTVTRTGATFSGLAGKIIGSENVKTFENLVGQLRKGKSNVEFGVKYGMVFIKSYNEVEKELRKHVGVLAAAKIMAVVTVAGAALFIALSHPAQYVLHTLIEVLMSAASFGVLEETLKKIYQFYAQLWYTTKMLTIIYKVYEIEGTIPNLTGYFKNNFGNNLTNWINEYVNPNLTAADFQAIWYGNDSDSLRIRSELLDRAGFTLAGKEKFFMGEEMSADLIEMYAAKSREGVKLTPEELSYLYRYARMDAIQNYSQLYALQRGKTQEQYALYMQGKSHVRPQGYSKVVEDPEFRYKYDPTDANVKLFLEEYMATLRLYDKIALENVIKRYGLNPQELLQLLDQKLKTKSIYYRGFLRAFAEGFVHHMGVIGGTLLTGFISGRAIGLVEYYVNSHALAPYTGL